MFKKFLIASIFCVAGVNIGFCMDLDTGFIYDSSSEISNLSESEELQELEDRLALEEDIIMLRNGLKRSEPTLEYLHGIKSLDELLNIKIYLFDALETINSGRLEF